METSVNPSKSEIRSSFTDKARAWYQASRPAFFVATFVPLTLGGVVASQSGSWNTVRWLVVLLGSFTVHLCTNLANDYYDYLSGADAGDSIGGSRVIQQGKITVAQLRNALIILYGIGFLCGAGLVWTSGAWWLAGLVCLAFFSSIFYTAPPIRYGYLGLGEVFVGVNMGPVMVVGTAAALSGEFLPRALWLSLPVGVMVAMILYYQSLPDMDADRAVGKMTVAVRLGKRRAAWGMRTFFTAALGTIVLLVALRIAHPAALLTLVSLPLAYKIDRMIHHTENWKDLHDKGGPVRFFYLANGAILIVAVAVWG